MLSSCRQLFSELGGVFNLEVPFAVTSLYLAGIRTHPSEQARGNWFITGIPGKGVWTIAQPHAVRPPIPAIGQITPRIVTGFRYTPNQDTDKIEFVQEEETEGALGWRSQLSDRGCRIAVCLPVCKVP